MDTTNACAANESSSTAVPVRKPEALSAQKFCGTEIEVGVEIGELQLTIDDLADLAPGTVFTYEFDPERPVSLLIGDERLAQARFVEQGGQLYLQIISVEG